MHILFSFFSHTFLDDMFLETTSYYAMEGATYYVCICVNIYIYIILYLFLAFFQLQKTVEI